MGGGGAIDLSMLSYTHLPSCFKYGYSHVSPILFILNSIGLTSEQICIGLLVCKVEWQDIFLSVVFHLPPSVVMAWESTFWNWSDSAFLKRQVYSNSKVLCSFICFQSDFFHIKISNFLFEKKLKCLYSLSYSLLLKTMNYCFFAKNTSKLSGAEATIVL